MSGATLRACVLIGLASSDGTVSDFTDIAGGANGKEDTGWLP